LPRHAVEQVAIGADTILQEDVDDLGAVRPVLEAAAVEGRLVVISLIGGARAEINLNTIMSKRLTLTGSTLRARTVAQKAAVADAVRRNVWPLLSAGRVRPIIHATFPLAEASEAHRLMEASTHIGKIVLTV
jgi:NADPH:quinone reductase-like Zn-dependent oxidoreductase